MRSIVHFVHSTHIVDVIQGGPDIVVEANQKHVAHFWRTSDSMCDFASRVMRSCMRCEFHTIPKVVKSDVLLNVLREIFGVTKLPTTGQQLVLIQGKDLVLIILNSNY